MKPNVASAKHGLVFGTLVVLAFLMVGARFLPLPGYAGTILLFAIAFVMAGLVVLQYMGLKWEGAIVYAVVAGPLVLFLILVLVLIPDVAHYPFHLRF